MVPFYLPLIKYQETLKKNFIYLLERGRESTVEGRGKGKQARGEADSPLSREPNTGLDPRTLRS